MQGSTPQKAQLLRQANRFTNRLPLIQNHELCHLQILFFFAYPRATQSKYVATSVLLN
jgi:hypothetical protein